MTAQPSDISADDLREPARARFRLALRFTAWGSIFPIRPGSKRPYKEEEFGGGWKSIATKDPAVIAQWFATHPTMNYGINPDPDIAVLDLDLKPARKNRPAKDGANTLSDMQASEMDFSLDNTLTMITPSGGQHRVVRIETPVANSVEKIGRGIDVRSHDGYIVGPGSHTEADELGRQVTGDYTCADPNGEIIDCPAWLHSRMDAPKPRDLAWDQCDYDLDLAHNVETARAFLKARSPAIEGQGGNDHTYATVVMARGFGISEETLFELLLSPGGWNERCTPPWDPAELWDIIEHGFLYAREKIGCRGSESPPHWEDLQAELSCVDDEAEWLTAAELVAGDYPPASWLWDGLLLERHVNLLYGNGGTGKTLLAEHLAVAIAAGVPLFGRATLKRPVVLVLCEDDRGETKKRLLAIASMLKLDLKDLPIHVMCRVGLDSRIASISDVGEVKSGPFREELGRKLDQVGECLLVLDTVSDIAALDETKRLAVNALCKIVVGGLCQRYGATVLMNAHPSKAAMVDGTHYSGSTAWNNAVRNRLTFRLPRDADARSPERVLETGKANYGGGASIELWSRGGLISDRAYGEVAQAEELARTAVLDALAKVLGDGKRIVRSNGDGLKPRDLMRVVRDVAGLTMSERQIKDRLAELEIAGRIRYRAATQGKNAVGASYEIVRHTFDLEAQ